MPAWLQSKHNSQFCALSHCHSLRSKPEISVHTRIRSQHNVGADAVCGHSCAASRSRIFGFFFVTGRLVVFRSNQCGIFVVCIVVVFVVVIVVAILCVFELLPSIAIASYRDISSVGPNYRSAHSSSNWSFITEFTSDWREKNAFGTIC